MTKSYTVGITMSKSYTVGITMTKSYTVGIESKASSYFLTILYRIDPQSGKPQWIPAY